MSEGGTEVGFNKFRVGMRRDNWAFEFIFFTYCSDWAQLGPIVWATSSSWWRRRRTSRRAKSRSSWIITTTQRCTCTHPLLLCYTCPDTQEEYTLKPFLFLYGVGMITYAHLLCFAYPLCFPFFSFFFLLVLSSSPVVILCGFSSYLL